MELIDKVKKALIDSGFPLEMRIAKILKEDDWAISMGSKYVDFETNVLREFDLTASKEVNGVLVHLFIECKKSDNKQLVLYAPTHNRNMTLLINPLRYFPKLRNTDFDLEKKLASLWETLPIYDSTIPISNNIIFTRGEKVEQNNDAFFNSLNGVVKKSIITGSDGYIETNFRMMFFHILIYDGVIFQVTDSNDSEFEINEVQYGQFKFEYRFKIPESTSSMVADLIKTSRFFSFSNIIEIMHPDFFQTYIESIKRTLLEISKKSYKGWGHSMEDFKISNKKAKSV